MTKESNFIKFLPPIFREVAREVSFNHFFSVEGNLSIRRRGNQKTAGTLNFRFRKLKKWKWHSEIEIILIRPTIGLLARIYRAMPEFFSKFNKINDNDFFFRTLKLSWSFEHSGKWKTLMELAQRLEKLSFLVR